MIDKKIDLETKKIEEQEVDKPTVNIRNVVSSYRSKLDTLSKLWEQLQKELTFINSEVGHLKKARNGLSELILRKRNIPQS